MSIEQALQGVSAVLVDSAPVIYHLEKNPQYASAMERFFAARSRGGVVIVTSPITLAECLVHPIRLGAKELAASYSRLIVGGENTRFHMIGEAEGTLAARLRAEHALKLADALQVAVAMCAGCEAILTNDPDLKRVPGIRMLVLKEMAL